MKRCTITTAAYRCSEFDAFLFLLSIGERWTEPLSVLSAALSFSWASIAG